MAEQSSSWTIRETDQPDAADSAAVLAILRRFSRETVNVLDIQDYAALVVDEVGVVRGGLTASSRWGGFHVQVLALAPELRGTGLGSQLMIAAENEARKRGCFHMLLDTHAFQAREFYEKHGWKTFGQIEGPAPYYPRYFMEKRLA